MANANTYNIELRDKSGNLKQYLTPFVTGVKWAWNRIGGCGNARISLKKGYRDIEFDAHDDIQIRTVSLSRLRANNDIDDEDMADISDWVDGDSGGGASSQATFDSKSCLKLQSGVAAGAGQYAARTQDLGSFGSTTVLSFNLYLDAVGTKGDDDHFAFIAHDGTNELLMSFGTDGIRVYDGASYVLIDANLVKTGIWQEWTFNIDWTAVTVDIYLDGVLKHSDVDCSYTSAGVDGKVGFYQLGYTTANRISYVDWFKAGSSTITARETKLVYRGFIEKVNPALKVDQNVSLDCRGYFDLLKKIVVHNSGDSKTYTDTELSAIVDDIADTFITPNSSITKGTIDTGVFIADTLEFRGSVDSALKTLAELSGNVEYGVDEDLVFYWRTESTTISHRFFVGDNVEMLERRQDWGNLLNKIYFQGADDSDGNPLLVTRGASDSQDKFFLAENILSNSAIISDSVADQYTNAILKEKSKPVLTIRAKIVNTDLRLEDTIPMGEVEFWDKDEDSEKNVWGTTANGGSNLIWGKTVNNGSNAKWGSIYHAQINRISYELSETSKRFNIEILLGDTILDTSAKLKRLELDVNSLRKQGG